MADGADVHDSRCTGDTLGTVSLDSLLSPKLTTSGLVLTPDSFDMAVCSEDPSLERIVRGDNAHLFPHYDPLFAAKFAYGPPKMSRELLQAIADRQPLLYSASQGKTMLADKLREVNILGDTVSLSIVCVPANIAVFVHLPALQAHLPTDKRPRQGGVLRHGRGAERRSAASGSYTWGLWTQV